MRFKTITILAIFTLALGLFACGGQQTPNDAANVTETNSTNSANTNTPITITKTPEIATTNEAPTFTPIVRAYCEAIIKKDDAALRKIHSQETLKIWDADMKSEGKTSLAEFLGELDPLTDAAKCGARNEKIDGDKGTAIIRTERMPDGIALEFVKENGAWKLTTKSPDIDKVKAAANSNTGK